MKHLLSSFLLFSICQLGFSQTEFCNAVIYWQYEGVITIYDEPNGTELTSIQHDMENENWAWLTIKELNGNYFLVEIGLAMDTTSVTGWIEKAEYVGAFMRHEEEYMDLSFYSNPNHKFSTPIEIKNWKAGFVTIEECDGEWTKVSVDFEGERMTGWIQSKKLCANNYTSCG